MSKLVALFFLIQFIRMWQTASSSDAIQTQAVQDLIKRLLGDQKATLFKVDVIGNSSAKDSFSLEKKNNILQIVGSSGVAAAYGFHFYLKYFCNCQISWDHDQLNLPKELPNVRLSLSCVDRYRYYQNVCTYSYSYAWWTWQRWERELDWMALNGYNMALAFIGQEAIWARVYQRINMTEVEINNHFAGPAYLAWSRMGNIRGWGGPLAETWHRDSVELQRKILKRMDELGIRSILPAFCGFVPVAFKRLYPSVKMTSLPAWVQFPSEYCCPYLLDPTEPLFQTIGRMFMQEMKNEFGLSHFYNCDTFNENRPHTEDPTELARISSAIYHTMDESDPKAIWILQGWLFQNDKVFWTAQRAKYFLGAVPNDRMIVLDLHSELYPQYTRLDSYFGKPFIWCMLHNFGGTLGMHGSLRTINSQITAARCIKNGTLVGTGLTMEGIHQNYVVYDFMSEVSWRNISVDLDTWAKKYSIRRYGKSNPNSMEAWQLLKNSIYYESAGYGLYGQYALCVRPNLHFHSSIWHKWYKPGDVIRAWDLMVNITEAAILNNSNFKHDMVDLTRQVFQIEFDELSQKLIGSFQRKDEKAFSSSSRQLLDLLQDLDLVLSTNTRFMLGSWIGEALSKGTTSEERKNLMWNAKNQITLWGPHSKSAVLDYATKQWSGIVIDYYYPRWYLFCKQLHDSLMSKTPFDQNSFNEMVFSTVEKPFADSSKMYPSTPQNDTIKIVKLLYDKWRTDL